jgi:hypothetical protein
METDGSAPCYHALSETLNAVEIEVVAVAGLRRRAAVGRLT